MSQHLEHHLKLHRLHFTEINELYIALSLQAFSVGLVGIFIPIYLYTLGFSLFQIAMYFVLFAIFTFIPFPLIAPLVLKRGPKHVIMLSFVIMLFYILLLYFLPLNKHLLYQTAIIGGFAEGVFWAARHMDLATILSKQKVASQFSLLLIFLTLAQAAAPLVGGFIASTYGIQYTLLGTSIGLLAAIYPLFRTPEPVIAHTRTPFRLLRTAPARYLLANFALNAQAFVGIFMWPFFIFLVVKTYDQVGAIASLSLLLCVGTLYVLGHLGDKGKGRSILTIGVTVRGLGHVARALSRSFSAALGGSIIGDIGDTIVSVPYAVRFYGEARKHDITSYFVDMEIAACLGKILPWLVLVAISTYTNLETALTITIILAALLMPLLRLIEPTSSAHNS